MAPTDDEIYEEGVRCYQGTGVPQDHKKAAELFAKAANNGHANAQIFLGFCCEHGHGVNTDISEAVYWYEKAAMQGHMIAEYNMGCCYENGISVPKDVYKAIEWYTRSSSKGYEKAKDALKRCHSGSEKAAEAPNKESVAIDPNMSADEIFELGASYFSGKGQEKDRMKATELWIKAAELGHAEAQYSLGINYRTGIYGPARDYQEAIGWYQKAAAQGMTEAVHEEGVCHYKMNNYAKAMECYRIAADKGYAQAQNDLGKCYADGTGTAKDMNIAKTWWEKAAAQGNGDAKENLRTISKK